MSCATIRTRSPARRTLPSSSVATPSFAAIARSPSWRFLKGITEVREITSRARIFDSCAMTSSVIPSAKYSFSGSALRFTNGSTATARARGRAEREGDAEVRHHRLAFVEQDVLRFDVPMDHTLVVRVAERGGDMPGDAEGFVNR